MIRRLACPYCYHRIAASRLWYQCSGRSAPGSRPCPKAIDEDRERQTGSRVYTRPAFPPRRRILPAPRRAICPDCGANSGVRVCPHCHTALPANFADSTSPLIALVGAKGTGKTVYLTVLGHELRNGLRRRFEADVRTSGGVVSSSTGDVTQLYTNRRLFEQTAAASDGRREPMVFEWRQATTRWGRPSFATTFLSFYDTAGEDLNNQGGVHDLAYLGAADALILMLDPFTLPQARERVALPSEAIRGGEPALEVLSRVTEALRAARGIGAKGKIKIPVAATFAKMDAFFDVLGCDHPLVRVPPTPAAYHEPTGRDTHEHIRALLHALQADDIDVHLRYNYAAFRYFAVSALGAEPDYATRGIDCTGIRPHRVDEPLVWLLARFGVVRVWE